MKFILASLFFLALVFENCDGLFGSPTGKNKAQTGFFRDLDTDENGKISMDEVRSFVGDTGGNALDEIGEISRAVENVFSNLDEDSDKTVKVEEFSGYIQHLGALLSADEVRDWAAHALQLPQAVVDKFVENGINGYDFPDLLADGGQLIESELGISKKAIKLKLVRGIRMRLLGMGRMPPPPRVSSTALSCGAINITWNGQALRKEDFPVHKYILERMTLVVPLGSGGKPMTQWLSLYEGAGREHVDSDISNEPRIQRFKYRLTAWNIMGHSEPLIFDAATRIDNCLQIEQVNVAGNDGTFRAPFISDADTGSDTGWGISTIFQFLHHLGSLLGFAQMLIMASMFFISMNRQAIFKKIVSSHSQGPRDQDEDLSIWNRLINYSAAFFLSRTSDSAYHPTRSSQRGFRSSHAPHIPLSQSSKHSSRESMEGASDGSDHEVKSGFLSKVMIRRHSSSSKMYSSEEEETRPDIFLERGTDSCHICRKKFKYKLRASRCKHNCNKCGQQFCSLCGVVTHWDILECKVMGQCRCAACAVQNTVSAAPSGSGAGVGDDVTRCPAFATPPRALRDGIASIGTAGAGTGSVLRGSDANLDAMAEKEEEDDDDEPLAGESLLDGDPGTDNLGLDDPYSLDGSPSPPPPSPMSPPRLHRRNSFREMLGLTNRAKVSQKDAKGGAVGRPPKPPAR
jgi:hypothetical protein